MSTIQEDLTIFAQGMSASSAVFYNASFTQLQSYTGAAAFAGWSTNGVSAYRILPASPTLSQLTDAFKTLVHDLMAPKT